MSARGWRKNKLAKLGQKLWRQQKYLFVSFKVSDRILVFSLKILIFFLKIQTLGVFW